MLHIINALNFRIQTFILFLNGHDLFLKDSLWSWSNYHHREVDVNQFSSSFNFKEVFQYFDTGRLDKLIFYKYEKTSQQSLIVPNTLNVSVSPVGLSKFWKIASLVSGRTSIKFRL